MTRCASEPEFPTEGAAWTPPDPILRGPIQTERLLITGFGVDDAAEINKVVDASRASLLPWMVWAKSAHRSIEDSTKWVAEQAIVLKDPGAFKGVALAIRDRETGEILGCTGVHDVRRDSASCETGYWIRCDRRGNGLAGEAFRAILSWALASQPRGLGLARVRVFCSADNVASRRVIEKVGLRREVHQIADYYVPGHGISDRLGWGVLASEWDAGNGCLTGLA